MKPVGHTSISAILGYRFERKYLVALLAGSLILDVDFILLPFPFFNTVHRHITHSHFFITISGIVLFLLIRNIDYKWFLLYIAGGVLHLFLDSILDANPSNGVGTLILWPFSKIFYSPFNLFRDYNTPYTGEQPGRFLFSLWKIYLIEIPLIITAFLMYFRRYKYAT